ncbi:MAG: TolC family protein [Nitrospira sp.]|nr:TolC family protein [Nitrospira sp.]HQY58150.1 TolC family protein [Nitrospira sp.]HRA95574.1 TolC family protein [Nitrospira sp.]
MPRLGLPVGRVLLVASLMAPLIMFKVAGATEALQATKISVQELHLSLRAAMAAAAEQNPSVLLSKERIEAAQGEVTTQLGALLPNLSANARQSQQTQFLGTFGLAPVRTEPFSIFDARVSASQNLFSLSLIQRWRASREALRVAEFDAQSSRFDTMASTGLAYLEGVKAAAALSMRQANLRLIQELLATTKLRQHEGAATGLEVARLEGQLANEQQQVVAAQAELDRAKNTLGNLLGLTVEVRMTLTDQLQPQVPEAAAAQAAWEQAVTNRAEVQAQAKRIKSAELSYSSVTGERLPSLVAQGDTGLIGNRWNNSLDTYNMALLLQIPLFDGGQREGRISTARSQVRQEAFRMQVVLNQVRAEVNEARIALAAARDKAALAQAGLQAATKETTLAKDRYAILTAASQFDVITAITSMARARENLVGALFELNAARVNYARATGTLESLG